MKSDAVTAILARISQREDVPIAMLVAVLTAMVQPGEAPDFGRVEQDLTRKAGEFRRLRDRLMQSVGQDEEIDRLRGEAARLLGEGRFAEADRMLAKAELRNLDGTVALDKMSKPRLLAAAGGRAERGATAMLKLSAASYREASQRFAEAAVIAGVADVEQGRVYSWMQADALARIGEDLGDREGFLAAIEHLRVILGRLNNFEDTVAWAATQDRLARALTGLAKIEGGSARLREAATVCRRTLEDLTPKLSTPLWTAMQGRLGRILATLGEADDDTDMLDQSVEALSAALSVTSRSASTAEWTDLQFELAKALVALGQRTNGSGHLESAINGFRHVLDEWPQATHPLQWSEVQDRMGTALCGLAVYYREPVVLEEAMAAFNAALEERPQQTLPVLWAESKVNRAMAGLMLARRLGDAGLAEQATFGMMGAVEGLRSAGLSAEAKRYEPVLAEAAALIEKLRQG